MTTPKVQIGQPVTWRSPGGTTKTGVAQECIPAGKYWAPSTAVQGLRVPYKMQCERAYDSVVALVTVNGRRTLHRFRADWIVTEGATESWAEGHPESPDPKRVGGVIRTTRTLKGRPL